MKLVRHYAIGLSALLVGVLGLRTGLAAEGPPAASAKAEPAPPASPTGSFHFGSYGRIGAGGDAHGRPAREVDIVAHGSRLDASNYVELELRREDHWSALDADTRLVATLAIGHPVFHYDGEFDAQMAVRNLFIEERGVGLRGLSMWVGSRMLRGDDIYLLDFWPLDNLNTLGAGLDYQVRKNTRASLHLGTGRPDLPFYRQLVSRPAPLNQFGVATVDILNRQRWLGSARLEQHFHFGAEAAIKLVAYGEAHYLPVGQRETEQPEVYEAVSKEQGFVIGGQFGFYTGERDRHLNLFFRYASGLAAYGAFSAPTGLGLDESTAGARELVMALGANWELGPFALMAGGYARSFRNASTSLDFGDVDEGIGVLRPQLFFLDVAGFAIEASHQVQQRGVLADQGVDTGGGNSASPKPLLAHLTRLAIMPMLSMAGAGSFKRPLFYGVYHASFRDDGARALYPADDIYSKSKTEHYFGVGAEWWFGSSSYGNR